MNRLRIPERAIFGIVIILIGGALLLNSTGILDIHMSIGTFWPLIFIVPGLAKLINNEGRSMSSIFMIIIGSFFLLRNLNVPIISDLSLGRVFWPGLIIVYGLTLILPEKQRNSSKPDTVYYDDEY